MVPNDIRNRYDAAISQVHEVGNRVRSVIRKHCDERGYLFEDRIKSMESVAEKVESGRFRSWSKLDDLYACTIVTPLPTEEAAVLTFLASKFEQIEVKRRDGVRKPPDVFRFDSTRFTGRLKAPVALPGEPGPTVWQIPFEVQIKSVFDYAWSKANHALIYKGDAVAWQSLRLSAQLKAIAETLDMLVLGFEGAADYVADGAWPAVSDKAAILQRFKGLIEQGLIPTELTPSSWTRFAENVYRTILAFSGEDPNIHYSKGIEGLEHSLGLVEAQIRELGTEKFPRSVSLFQFVLSVLGKHNEAQSENPGYTPPIPENIQALFGDVNLPCQGFDCNG